MDVWIYGCMDGGREKEEEKRGERINGLRRDGKERSRKE